MQRKDTLTAAHQQNTKFSSNKEILVIRVAGKRCPEEVKVLIGSSELFVLIRVSLRVYSWIVLVLPISICPAYRIQN